MKKIILLSILTFIPFVLISAKKSPLKITEGDICPLLTESSEAILEIDYSNTTWEEDEDYKSFCGEDYDIRVLNSKNVFTNSFNALSTGIRINNDSETPKYKIILKPIDLERSLNLFTGQASIILTASVEIINISSNDLVLQVNIKEYEGDCDYVPNDRLDKCFSGVATELILLGQKCK